MTAERQAAIDHIPEGLLVCDDCGYITGANASVCSVLGISSSGLIGQHISLFLGNGFELAASTSASLIPFESSFAGKPVRLMLRVQAVNSGSARSFFLFLRKFRNQNNSRSHAPEVSFLADHINALVLIWHPRFGIAWSNTYTGILTGYSQSELFGRSFIDSLVSDQTPSQTIDELRYATQAQKSFRLELLLRHRQREPFWARIEARPITDSSGVFDRFVIMGVDITADRHEKAIQNSFCSMVSHELRTPLTVITGTLEALDYQLPDTACPGAAEMIDMGKRNCAQLAGLIEDVLELSQIETGEFQIEEERIDIVDLVQQTAITVEPLFEASGHQLDVTLPASAVYADVDPKRIRQVVTNLLSNARKFSKPGSLVSLAVAHTDTGHVEISIRDRGIGIAPEFIDKLYDRFSRAVDVRASGVEGFGLGLSITHRLVHQMHGTIRVESEQNEGTTFYVQFPVVYSDGENPHLPPADNAQPAGTGEAPGLRQSEPSETPA